MFKPSATHISAICFSCVRLVIHHSEMNSSSLTDLADVNFTSFVGVHISLFYVFPLTSPRN